MAAKTIKQAIEKAQIRLNIELAVCLKKGDSLAEAIEKATKDIEKNLLNEFRDLVSHRAMIVGKDASAVDLFKDLCGDISATKE